MTATHGLEDVVAASTRLSGIDGDAGELTIAGFPLQELAPHAKFEEALHLLWHDRLPTRDEYEGVRRAFGAEVELPRVTRQALAEAARSGVPAMDALRMAVGTLDLLDPHPDDDSIDANRQRALRLIARFPVIIGMYWRLQRGETPVEPDPDLSHAEQLLYMITGEQPDPEFVRALDTYLVTVIDHGMNASTFTGRVITSTLSDMVSAMTGAIGALKGPLHGGAPGPALDMIFEIAQRKDAEDVIRGKLERGERLMGFGHRVYKVRDPRADVLAQAAERLFERAGDRSIYDLARQTEEIALRLLQDHKPNARLETNVEFYTALVLHGVGLPSELFSPTFATGRVGGWTAHVLEQLAHNRLIRPQSEYDGPTDRTWTPMEER
ncbi:MAG: citrate synthase [Candidatus Bipolaricaulia bacterium]